MKTPPSVPPQKHASDAEHGTDEADRFVDGAEAEAAADAALAARKPGRFASQIARARPFISWVKEHERTLSALGMLGGFVSDNLMFRRIDLPNTQAIFAGYLTLAAVSILGLHFLERRAREGKMYARWRSLLPMATQFALGGLWSGFLVFYSRSAVVTASWPYLALLASFLVGNEVLKRYHDRLVFTAILFFFAVFTFAIVEVPIYTHHIGQAIFLLSGAVAVGVLILFLYLLAAINRPQFVAARGKIALGVIGVYVAMNAVYFTNTLPPLPLALVRVGVYHGVKHTAGQYVAQTENNPWYTSFGVPAVLHVKAGEPLYAYSAVFAPTQLTTRIVHRWRRFDEKSGHWLTLSTVSFPINGGRDGGYRGYTIKHSPQPGDWRVDIDTSEGHIIGRIAFKVERADAAPVLTAETLK